MDKVKYPAQMARCAVLAASVFVLPLTSAAETPRIHGFTEAAYGAKLVSDETKHDAYNMLEQRTQLRAGYTFEGDNYLAQKSVTLNFKGDFIVDGYEGYRFVAEVRELDLSFTPFDIMDVKAGKQTLTWGTGDYIFLNDLFPKDYISFLIGRDDEYLKVPSDAVRIMFYPKWVNVDAVLIPIFTPNTIPDGDRVSFFDPFQGGIAARSSDRFIYGPAEKVKNMVYAGRLYRNFGSYETALYYYRGFDPSPRSYKDETAGQIYHERLDAYGASIRGPVPGGIANVEVSYHLSPEDIRGDIRTIQNSMMKYLAGYDKDLGGDLKVGVQYYLEQTLDYARYEKALMPSDYRWDQLRHTVTARVTKYLANQTLKLSVFTFFSPSDMDLYTRPSLTWNATDAWTLTVGANLPWGRDSWTEWGSFQKNKNVYIRLRYGF